MPKKAWLLYSIEFGADKYEHGIVLGEECGAKDKAAAALFLQRVAETYRRSGGDAAVVSAWKEKLFDLGMGEGDLVGKSPPPREFEAAWEEAKKRTSEVTYHAIEVL